MNTNKFALFCKEFPALPEILGGALRNGTNLALDCETIKVSRVSDAFLALTPEWYGWSGSVVGIDRRQSVALVMKDGKVQLDFVSPDVTCGSNEAHSQTSSRDGQSILDSLAELDDATISQTTYLVLVSQGQHVIDHFSTREFVVEIAKVKDFDLLGAVNAYRQKLAADVAAECAA